MAEKVCANCGAPPPKAFVAFWLGFWAAKLPELNPAGGALLCGRGQERGLSELAVASLAQRSATEMAIEMEMEWMSAKVPKVDCLRAAREFIAFALELCEPWTE